MNHMSSEFGKLIKTTIFGQSHSAGIGVVIDGIPAGEPIDIDEILSFMQRRIPVNAVYSTARSESDIPEILSGIVDGVTCGAPISAIIRNNDTRSKDYTELKIKPRPSHSDYAAAIKYGEAHDIRGGGHFSGRLTAPLCFAGAICKQILYRKGIIAGAHIASIGDINDDKFDSVHVSPDDISNAQNKKFPVINDKIGEIMLSEIKSAANEGDSIGGTVECCIIGLPTGVGEPMFEGIENKIAQAIFAIPAVKGIEFGSGFDGSKRRGSENNDAYQISNGKIGTVTNNSGGINGGLTNGMPIIFRVAFKPTSSIAKEQQTVDLSTLTNTTVTVKGRHDPCIVPRAVPCVEAAAMIALLDLLYERQSKL